MASDSRALVSLTMQDDGGAKYRMYFDSSDVTHLSENRGAVSGDMAYGICSPSGAHEYRGEGPISIENHGYWSQTLQSGTIVVEANGQRVGTVEPNSRAEIELPAGDGGGGGGGSSEEPGSGSSGGGSLSILPPVGPLSSRQTTIAAGALALLAVVIIA